MTPNGVPAVEVSTKYQRLITFKCKKKRRPKVRRREGEGRKWRIVERSNIY